jgi:2'-5' RNA ligase
MKILRKIIIRLRKLRFIFNIKIIFFVTIRIPDNDTVEDVAIDISPPRYLTLSDSIHKPNYFLSIPITDPTLITNYIAYRDHLLSSYPSLFSSRANSSDPPHLHITLLTLRIETSPQIEQCTIALKRLQEEIRYHCSYPEPIYLELNGIDTFYDKVLYVKCKQNQRLENLRTLIVERFSEQQQKQKLNEIFFAGNYYEFIPHITLMKCKRRFSSINQNETKEIFFGKQTIDSLQLCSIGKSEQDDQNNNCIFKLNLN